MALSLDTNFYIAVIVATIVSFVIGGIWYSRAAFEIGRASCRERV